MSDAEYAELIRKAKFQTPAVGQAGYSAEDVDRFLDWLEQSVAARVDPATLADGISQAKFAIGRFGRRGYRPEDVDNFLDVVSATYCPSEPPAATSADTGPAAATQPPVALPGLGTGNRDVPSSPSGSAVVEHKSFFQRLFGR